MPQNSNSNSQLSSALSEISSEIKSGMDMTGLNYKVSDIGPGSSSRMLQKTTSTRLDLILGKLNKVPDVIYKSMKILIDNIDKKIEQIEMSSKQNNTDIEKLSEKIKVFSKENKNIHTKIDNLNNKINQKINDKLEALSIEVDSKINTRIKELSDKFDTLNEDVDRKYNTQIKELKDKFDTLNEDVGQIKELLKDELYKGMSKQVVEKVRQDVIGGIPRDGNNGSMKKLNLQQSTSSNSPLKSNRTQGGSRQKKTIRRKGRRNKLKTRRKY